MRMIQDFLNDRSTEEVGVNMDTNAADESFVLQTKGKGKGKGRQGDQARPPAGENAGRKGAPAEKARGKMASRKPGAAMSVAGWATLHAIARKKAATAVDEEQISESM